MGLFSGLFEKKVVGTLKRFHYSPGYCDMLGASHSITLEKNSDGNWVYITRDREEHSQPMTVITYAVSGEAAAEFEKFIKESDFPALAKRPRNRGFMTDYSPWGYYLDFDCSASGGSRNESFDITQYHEYTNKDDALMKEVLARFYALKGDKISEVKEDN